MKTIKFIIIMILGIVMMSFVSCNGDSDFEKIDTSVELAQQRYEAYPYKNISQDEASRLKALARETSDIYTVVSKEKKIDLGDFKSISILEIKDGKGNKTIVYYAENLRDDNGALGVLDDGKIKLLLEEDGLGGIRIIGSSKIK